MDRAKKNPRNQICCLVGLLSLLPFEGRGSDFKIGEVTQIKGAISPFRYAPPHEVTPVKLKQDIITEGSYLTQESANMVITLFDGSHIRLNPKSKMALEYTAESGVITIHLISGSLKVRFQPTALNDKAQKLVVKSADTYFETVNGKYSVVRSLITDENSVYVESGSVVVSQFVAGEKKDTEIVHAKEMTSVKDNTSDIESPKMMTEKQINFLKPENYLK